MKKRLALALAAALVLSLTACGSSDSGTNELETPNQVSVTSDKQEEAPEEAEGEPEAEPAEEKAEAIQFDPITAIENDACAVVITGIDPENTYGYTVKLQVENKTADQTLRFGTDSCAINGVSVNAFLYEEVAAGKKANTEIELSDDMLDMYDIGEYSDIRIAMNVCDADDYSADPVVKESFHIYPIGEENATKYTREKADSDIVITDTDDVFCSCIGYKTDEFWGYEVYLYAENRADYTEMFSIEDASINGFMADPYCSYSIGNGDCGLMRVYWMEEDLAEIGINDFSEIEEIEFSVRISNYDDWHADDLANETVTLNP